MTLVDDLRTFPGLQEGLRCLLALATISLFGCASLSGGSSARSVRVMSYNIQYGHEGLDSVAAVIRAERPDIVGLQEVDVHWSARSNFVDQAAALSKATGMEYRFARIYQLPGGDPSKPPREFGVALLSRYPVISFINREITRLSTQDSVAKPALMPGLLDATVNVNGRRVRFLNVHLDYRVNPSVRETQVAEILSFVGKETLLTILTGDLNASPDAVELQPLFVALHDTWKAGVPGLTFSAAKPEKKIDYVLVSDGLCRTKSVIPRVYASDHFPLVVDLTIGKC
ncbi:MAG TPA: endonuclease/exonuclease/phosphatase family protein [Gemmatimonadaceae bacterium]|nr:endonuclease/exonuclease/phosphatase family protein [Gemmatimonadaceae bacterium]